MIKIHQEVKRVMRVKKYTAFCSSKSVEVSRCLCAGGGDGCAVPSAQKVIHHFELALGIASPLNWPDRLFWVNYSPARLLSEQGGLDDAHARVERAKSHAVDDACKLGRAMNLQANFWYNQHMFEEAKLEALRAVGLYEKAGATS